MVAAIPWLMLRMAGKMWMLSGLAPMQQLQDAQSLLASVSLLTSESTSLLFPVLAEKATLMYVVWSKE